MLTIFSTPKPFRGHINVIQRNAIQSWKLLHPDVEVILVGDDYGAAEVCQEFGIRHLRQVRRSPTGAVYLDDLFDRGQHLASYPVTCYVNCDIVMMSDFRDAISRVKSSHDKFLIVGRRWDTDITEPLNFSLQSWEADLRSLVSERGQVSGGHSSDYFVFPRNLYDRTPPMVVARCWWDNWLIWKAKSRGARVIDATRAIVAVHQNHDYSYHQDGFAGTLWGDESLENRRLAGNRWRLHTVHDATYKLTPRGTNYNWVHFLGPAWRHPWKPVWQPVSRRIWFFLLDLTRPIRHFLGLRRAIVVRSRR